MSEFFVKYWYPIFGGLGGGVYFFIRKPGSGTKVLQHVMDRIAEVAGLRRARREVLHRTLDADARHDVRCGRTVGRTLDSVGGAAGNCVFERATVKIQHEVSTGTALTVAMTNANLFPSMVLQMCAIGEESGSIDHMLGKAADFFEAEVDDMVAGISSLMEPIIIVILAPSSAVSWSRCTADLQARSRGPMLGDRWPPTWRPLASWVC